MDIEEAKKALAEEIQERKKSCQEELNNVLKKYNFRLVAAMILTEQGAKSTLDLIPLD